MQKRPTTQAKNDVRVHSGSEALVRTPPSTTDHSSDAVDEFDKQREVWMNLGVRMGQGE